MRIQLEQLRDHGRVFEFAPRADSFPVLRQLAAEGAAAFLGPLRVRLRAAKSGEIVTIEGRLDSRVRLACSRCLEEFDGPLAADFSLAYLRSPAQPASAAQETEREIAPDEIGVVYFQGEEIDLTDAVQEQAVMALPLRPLCREGCRGICPGCGAELNRESCRCPAPAGGGPFAARFGSPIKRR
jgi:uncharacterized protein